jgi:hypothetical protein
MPGQNQNLQQPNQKGFAKRVFDGFRFTNTGLQRLFIVSLVAIPLLIGVLSKPRDDYDDFSPNKFLQIAFASLLAYLLFVRVGRWVWDGFFLQKPEAQANSRDTAAFTTVPPIIGKTETLLAPVVDRAALSWIVAAFAALFLLLASGLALALYGGDPDIFPVCVLSGVMLIFAMLLQRAASALAPQSKSDTLPIAIFAVILCVCPVFWATWLWGIAESLRYTDSVSPRTVGGAYGCALISLDAFIVWLVPCSVPAAASRRKTLMRRAVKAGAIGFVLGLIISIPAASQIAKELARLSRK